MSQPENQSDARVALFQRREIRRTVLGDAWWLVVSDIQVHNNCLRPPHIPQA